MMDPIIEWVLRFAAWRWPADVRHEQAREWAAELEAVDLEAGGRMRGALARLRFVVSLAASPPLADGYGAPRGWREVMPQLGRRLRWPTVMAAVGLAAMLATQVLSSVLGALAGSGDGRSTDTALPALGGGAVQLAITVVCAVVGYRLGRRASPSAALAVPAALALTIGLPYLQFVAKMSTEGSQRLHGIDALAGCALVWALLLTGLVAGVTGPAARHRWLAAGIALIWVPAAAAAAMFVGMFILATRNGGRSGIGSLVAQPLGQVTSESSTMSATSGQTNLHIAGNLLIFGALAASFALATTRSPAPARPAPGQAPPAPVPAWRLSAAATVTGLVGLTVGVLAWAYTIAVQTQDMRRVSSVAPMPGGDGELYLWVAELRWAAIVLAALGLLLAAADRPAAPLAAMVLGGALLGADAVAERLDASGPDALRGVLIVAAMAVALAWWIAGARRPPATVRTRRRLAVTAMVAAYTGPLVFGQGTPAVNHPFLPVGLAVVMATVPAVFVLVAAVSAGSARPRPMGAATAGVLFGLPAVLFVVLGAGTASGLAVDLTQPVGIALAGPLVVATVAVLHPHRRRSVARTLWVRTGLLLAAAAAVVPLVLLGVFMSLYLVTDVLFALAGTGYPADGISIIPGAALVAVPAAAVIAARRIRPGPAVSTGPTTPTGPTGPFPVRSAPCGSSSSDWVAPSR